MQDHTEKEVRRYHYIDSIRGFAALSVIIYHIIEYTPPRNEAEKLLRSLFFDEIDLGKIAVTVFFAISGFVIPFSLLKPSLSPLRDFVISRFFRLYPAYWLSILGAVITLYVMRRVPIPIVETLINITMLQQFFGFQNLVGVYWTLQIELIFYFLCAVLFRFGWFERPSRIRIVIWFSLILALVLGIIRFYSNRNLPVALPLALSIMFSGSLWRRYSTMSESELGPDLQKLLVGYIVFVPITAYFSYAKEWLNYTLTYYIAIAIFLTGTSVLKVGSPISAYLGRLSYSLYLFGSLATVLCASVLKYSIGYIDSIYLALFTIMLSVICCGLIYRFVEAPSIRLGQKITKQLNSRKY